MIKTKMSYSLAYSRIVSHNSSHVCKCIKKLFTLHMLYLKKTKEMENNERAKEKDINKQVFINGN